MKNLIEKLERLRKGLLLIGSAIDAETCQEAITALKQKEWISVEDGLPETDDEVLIIASGEVVQAYLKNGIWKGSIQVTDNMNDGYVHDRDICKQGTAFDYVTHWMPLPTPPTES